MEQVSASCEQFAFKTVSEYEEREPVVSRDNFGEFLDCIIEERDALLPNSTTISLWI